MDFSGAAWWLLVASLIHTPIRGGEMLLRRRRRLVPGWLLVASFISSLNVIAALLYAML